MKKGQNNSIFCCFFVVFSQNIYMYFNYHAKVRRLIENGKAVEWEIVGEYHKICPCLLIYFENGQIFPIRQNKFEEYMFLLAKFDIKQKK